MHVDVRKGGGRGVAGVVAKWGKGMRTRVEGMRARGAQGVAQHWRGGSRKCVFGPRALGQKHGRERRY